MINKVQVPGLMMHVKFIKTMMMIMRMIMMMTPPCSDVDNADGGEDVILFSRKETARLILLWGTICLESHPSHSAVNDFFFSIETF